jgi:hypothetical protein
LARTPQFCSRGHVLLPQRVNALSSVLSIKDTERCIHEYVPVDSFDIKL